MVIKSIQVNAYFVTSMHALEFILDDHEWEPVMEIATRHHDGAIICPKCPACRLRVWQAVFQVLTEKSMDNTGN